jgi:methionyl-tRNA formyltransferase
MPEMKLIQMKMQDTYDRLMGSETVINTLELMKRKCNNHYSKDSSEIKSAFKLNKENCKIDWTKSASEINNLIRVESVSGCMVCVFRQK